MYTRLGFSPKGCGKGDVAGLRNQRTALGRFRYRMAAKMQRPLSQAVASLGLGLTQSSLDGNTSIFPKWFPEQPYLVMKPICRIGLLGNPPKTSPLWFPLKPTPKAWPTENMNITSSDSAPYYIQLQFSHPEKICCMFGENRSHTTKQQHNKNSTKQNNKTQQICTLNKTPHNFFCREAVSSASHPPPPPGLVA